MLRCCGNGVVLSTWQLSTFPVHANICMFNAVELQRFRAHWVLMMPVSCLE